MPPSTAPLSPTRVAAALIVALLWIGVAGAAGAATPDAVPPESPKASAIERWKGRFCTTTSCRSAPASPLGAAASFGAAILAIGWMTRRPAARMAGPNPSGPSTPASSAE